MKLHKNLLIGLHAAFSEALAEDKYADKVLERVLKSNKKWGGRDRSFVSETFYEIIRWKRNYEYFIGKPLDKDSIYEVILAYLLNNKMEFQMYDEFHGISVSKLKDKIKKDFPTKAIKYSIPDWMQTRLEKELPDRWEKEIRALNVKADPILRVNTLKTTKEKLINQLKEDHVEVEAINGYKDALRMTFKKNAFRTQAFQDGLFEMQDASSQKVVEAVDVQPGMKVIDACAGAGGKTLHLAARMENKGSIIALDIFDWKLQELKRRARRAGVHTITTRVIEDTKVIKRLANSADRVLIDAPCSGLGVLRRNPDAKWKLQEEFIGRMIHTQKEILQSYSRMVKVDGILVYVTCSILPSENELQVKEFITKNPNFVLLYKENIFPSDSGFDGFFIAKMKKISI